MFSRFVSALATALVALAAGEGLPGPQAPKINVGGVVHAATNRPAPDNYISPGAIISIYGTGLAGETREVRASDLVNGYLPETLANVSVYFGLAPAPLFYVSPTQINAQAPTGLQPGEWEVTVRYNRLESRATVTVRAYAPGLFPVARHTDGRLVDGNGPARPREWLLFFGTGFGPTTPALLAGALAPLEPVPMVDAQGRERAIEVQIGGFALDPADIYYAGLAPGYAGLYQFNLRVPPGTAGLAQVLVKVGEEWTPPVRIPVAP